MFDVHLIWASFSCDSCCSTGWLPPLYLAVQAAEELMEVVPYLVRVGNLESLNSCDDFAVPLEEGSTCVATVGELDEVG